MEITEDIYAQVRRFMAEHVPFNKYLGVEVLALREGFARLVVPFRPEFIGDPMRPALHGGLISTLLDACGGAAVWTTTQSLRDRVSTIDLRVDYLRPGRSLALVAEAHVLRAGNRVGVTSMRAFHRDAPDEAIADGRGVYNVKRGTGAG